MKLSYNTFSAATRPLRELVEDAQRSGCTAIGLAMAHLDDFCAWEGAFPLHVTGAYVVFVAADAAMLEVATSCRQVFRAVQAPITLIPRAEWRDMGSDFATFLQRLVLTADDVPFQLEPMHGTLAQFSSLTDFDEALHLAQSASISRVRVVLDFAHVGSARILRLSPAEACSVSVVHVCDVKRGKRCVPGAGSLDIRGLCRRLTSIGFEGWWEMEVYEDAAGSHVAPKDCLMPFHDLILP